MIDAGPLPPCPARPEDGHKGTFGTVCILGGQARPPRLMIGGPALSAQASLRVGAGLAVLAMPASILPTALAIAPEATGLALPEQPDHQLHPSSVAEIIDRELDRSTCLAIGPGLGTSEASQQIVIRLIANTESPLVLDADALNALALAPEFSGDLRADAVLTPHPGEFRRLAAALGIREDPVEHQERVHAAGEMARRLGCIVVLKGAGTVVSDGMRHWTCDERNPALATAGSGDILTGVIAGLIAQFFRPHLGTGTRQITPESQGGLNLFDCARLGVHLHAMAGKCWSSAHGSAGLLARDLLAQLPSVMNNWPRSR